MPSPRTKTASGSPEVDELEADAPLGLLPADPLAEVDRLHLDLGQRRRPARRSRPSGGRSRGTRCGLPARTPARRRAPRAGSRRPSASGRRRPAPARRRSKREVEARRRRVGDLAAELLQAALEARSCGLPQLLAQAPERPGRPRLDGAAPQRQHLRGLFLAELEQVAARERPRGRPRSAARARPTAPRAPRRRLPSPRETEPRLPREARVRRAGQGPRAGPRRGGGCAPRSRRSRAARGETARRGGSAAARATPSSGRPGRRPRRRRRCGRSGTRCGRRSPRGRGQARRKRRRRHHVRARRARPLSVVGSPLGPLTPAG